MGNTPSQVETRVRSSYEELLQRSIGPLVEVKSEEVVEQEVMTAKPKPPSHFSPGVYVLLNYSSGSALDLSGGDSRSIIGFDSHGLGNQQVCPSLESLVSGPDNNASGDSRNLELGSRSKAYNTKHISLLKATSRVARKL